MLELAVGQPGDGPGLEVAPVDVSPSRLVRDVHQRTPVRREGALEDGCLGAAGGHFGTGEDRQAALGEAQARDLQLGSVPGHAGVIPFDPREPVPGRVPGWLHVEVPPIGEPLGPVLPLRVHHGDAVDVLVGVDIGDPAAIGRYHRGGGGPERRRDWPSGAAREFLAVDALVGLADEERGAVGQGEVAAAVAHEGTHGPVGGEVAGGALVRPLGDDDATVRAALDPGEGLTIAVPAGLAEPKACGEGGRGDGARPEAEHAGFAGHGPRLLGNQVRRFSQGTPAGAIGGKVCEYASMQR